MRIIKTGFFVTIFLLLISNNTFAAKTKKSKKDKQKAVVTTVTEPVDLSVIPEIEQLSDFPKPPENLHSLINEKSLSSEPLKTEYEGIYAVSYTQMQWKPQEDFFDVYVFDKKINEYVCRIENCYKGTFWQNNYGSLGKVQNVWSKDNAYYLFEKDRFAFCDENGFEYITGYLSKTKKEKMYFYKPTWEINEACELRDYYIYSKKENRIVALVKNCYKDYYNKGLKGWNNQVKDAYSLINADKIQYLFEASDYYICNKDGYEYINGYSYKIETPDVFGESVSVTRGKVTVIAEPVRELFYVCKRLSNFDGRWECDELDDYLSDLYKYFSEYKDHPAVVFLNEHLNYFELDEYSMTSCIYNLKDSKTYTGEECIFNSGEKFDYYNYFNLLVDFAEKSNFKAFFESHADYYKSYVIENGFKCFDSVEEYNSKFLKQSKKTTYSIYMHKSGWADINRENPNSYIINSTVNENSNGVGLAHELSHPIMNPVMIKLYNSDLQYRFNILFNQNAGSIAVYSYTDPVSYWCDGFVRAAAGLASKEEWITGYLNDQVNYVGFAMVPQMYEKLKELRNTKYNSFEDLYDELYKFFDENLPR